MIITLPKLSLSSASKANKPVPSIKANSNFLFDLNCKKYLYYSIHLLTSSISIKTVQTEVRLVCEETQEVPLF